MVNGEIIPEEALLAFRATTVRRRVPKDAALRIAETALGVLFGKETFQQAAHDALAQPALIHLVSRLHHSQQVCATRRVCGGGAAVAATAAIVRRHALVLFHRILASP